MWLLPTKTITTIRRTMLAGVQVSLAYSLMPGFIPPPERQAPSLLPVAWPLPTLLRGASGPLHLLSLT